MGQMILTVFWYSSLILEVTMPAKQNVPIIDGELDLSSEEYLSTDSNDSATQPMTTSNRYDVITNSSNQNQTQVDTSQAPYSVDPAYLPCNSRLKPCSNDNLTTEKPEERKNTAASRIERIGWAVVPTLFIIGLCGNILTIVILHKNSFQKLSIDVVLTVLAISDTVMIIMQPFNKKFFIRLISFDVRGQSLLSCKLFFWVWRCAKMTSSWFVVLISMERFVAVWFPMRANVINSKSHILILIGCVYTTIFSFNASWGVFCDVKSGSHCMPNMPVKEEHRALAANYVIAGTMIYSIIPVTIIFFLNCLTITQLFTQHARRQEMSSIESQSTNSGQTVKTTAMLLSVSIAFLVLVVPISIVHCISLLSNEPIFQSTNPKIVILRETAQIMEQLNHACNFFFYVLTSERFRKEFLFIIGVGRCCLKDKVQNRQASLGSKYSSTESFKDTQTTECTM